MEKGLMLTDMIWFTYLTETRQMFRIFFILIKNLKKAKTDI